MADQDRQHKRIEKSITIQFCLADAYPKKWDMSVIENISAGGLKFIAPSDLDLNNKVVQLQIKIPALAPHILELEAMVLHVKLNAKVGFNTKYSEVRAQFINLSEANKKHLSVLEKMMGQQKDKKM